MADYPEVAYWLALINESGLKLNIIKPIILRWCLTEKRSLADLFDMSPLELSTTFGLTDAQADRISQAAGRLEPQRALLAEWRAKEIETIIRTDARYPQRLATILVPAQQPLILWTRGPIDFLNRPGVTMLGRKNPDAAIAEFIKTLMSALEAEDIGLISGYDRGLDRVTFEMMLDTRNGYTLAMLPLGLEVFAQTTSRLDQAIEAKRTLLVTPFSPETGFDERLADARNLLIDHLTLALLIPESDEESQARAKAALDRGLPVFVKADTAENRELLNQGALLLTDPGEVIDWVQQAMLDAAFQADENEPETEDIMAAPLSVTAPAEPLSDDENYALRAEDLPPIDSQEAMEILSMGGEVPEILRRRLEKREDQEE